MKQLNKGTRILVIGIGKVGEEVARNLSALGYDLTVYNRSQEKLKEFLNRNKMNHVGNLQDLEGKFDAVVHAAGVARSATVKTRSDLYDKNLGVVIGHIEQVVEHLGDNAHIVSVTNPPEVIADVKKWLNENGVKSDIYATGVGLDSWRLKNVILPGILNLSPSSIQGAYVISDHGSNLVLALDKMTVDGKPYVVSEEDRKILEKLTLQYSKMRRYMGSEDFRDKLAIQGDWTHPAEDVVTVLEASLGKIRGDNNLIPVQVVLDERSNYGFAPEEKGLIDLVGYRAVGHLLRVSDSGRLELVSPEDYLSRMELDLFMGKVAKMHVAVPTPNNDVGQPQVKEYELIRS